MIGIPTLSDYSWNVMLVGVGGGFDVFTGLPLVFRSYGVNFTLVNSSPSDKFHYRESTPEDLPEGRIRPNDKFNGIRNVYSVGRGGYKMVKQAYQEIMDKHHCDMIFAVDGGVDSLATGNEKDPGTLLEDSIGLAALQDIQAEKKILCCAGFGTETEENLNHYRILENIAALAGEGAFLGSFSLTKDMPEFKLYKEECEHAWADNRRKSHIQTKIISAVNGQFGDKNEYTDIDPRVVNSTGVSFVSPLSSIYWYFDLDAVAKRNKVVPALKATTTFIDAKIVMRDFLNKHNYGRTHIPLPL